MSQDFRGFDPFLRVGLEHSSEEVKCLSIYILVDGGAEIEFQFFIVIVDLFTFLSFKERSADEHDVEDGSKRKYIAFRLDMVSLVKGGHFGGNIARGSASIEHVIIGVGICSQAEIDNDGHESGLSSQHDVFRLDVAMHDPIVMHFLKT